MEEFVLVLNKRTGQMKVEALGFIGPACEEATEELIQLIGAKTVDTTAKEEYAYRATINEAGL